MADRSAPAALKAAAIARAKEWRGELENHGLLSGRTDAERRDNAQDEIRKYGILEDQEKLQCSHNFAQIPLGVAVTYANAHGRFTVDECVCGYSFARTNDQGKPIPLTASGALYPHLFAWGNGIPPFPFFRPVPSAQQSTQQPPIAISILMDGQATDTAGAVAQAVRGVLALRRVVTGVPVTTQPLPVTTQPLSAEEQRQHERIAKGIEEVRATGQLNGKPGIIVHGRGDGVIAPNHTSRAYVALNHLVERANSNLRYIEVTNTHHFDAFNAISQFELAKDFNSLHPYLLQALSWMRDYLARKKKLLPPSQVVDTKPRGLDQNGHPNPIDPLHPQRNLPPITANPGKNEIKFDRMTETLIIP